MVIIDGKAIAQKVRNEVKENVQKDNFIYPPHLAIIRVGDDPASATYVKNKTKASQEVGIEVEDIHLTECTQKGLENFIENLNYDEGVNGILVQLPLPSYLDTNKILNRISPEKDVDGFTDVNMGRLFAGKECTVACTPAGIMRLLDEYNIEIEGKKVVIVGRSNIVGKPMAALMLNRNATVTICHSKTKNLKEECLQADILIIAIGRPKFITADMVKEGAVVIDVGINRDENNRLCGDVDFENVAPKCSFITPVPGGVGPMTVAMLMKNTYEAMKKRYE